MAVLLFQFLDHVLKQKPLTQIAHSLSAMAKFRAHVGCTIVEKTGEKSECN